MRAIIVAISVLFAGVIPGPSVAQSPDKGTLEVTGTGTVSAEPDMANITLGVATRSESAGAALSRTSEAVARVFEALDAAGIASGDLQTANINLSPLWNDRPGGTSGPDLTGFEASNTITVKVRDLNRLGAILDATAEAGANTFQGLSFALQEPSPSLEEARRLAVADAIAKAKLYADAAGVSLGTILRISEPVLSGPSPVMRAAAFDEGLKIAPGEVSTAASVTMVFEITQP